MALPKKYAKMGFKKGWREYKRNRKAGTAKRKVKPTVRRRRKVSRKRRTYKPATMSGRRRTVATRLRPRNIMNVTQKTAVRTGIGVAGAIGTAAAVNMLPIEDDRAKALTQAGIGLGAMIMLPKRNVAMRVAAGGATLAGMLSAIKTSGMNLPLLAGYKGMGANFYPRMGANKRYKRLSYSPTTETVNRRTPATANNNNRMGANLHVNNMAGYGSKFMTQANM